MKIAIVGIGIPGSGKTTLLKPLAEQLGYAYVNRDDVRERMLGDALDVSNQETVRQATDAAARDALQQADGVIYDATFATPEKRQAVTTLMRAAGADRIVGVWLQVPLEVALSRNASRDRHVPDDALFEMAASLAAHPPRLTDGFDALVAGSDIDDLTAAIEREVDALRAERS